MKYEIGEIRQMTKLFNPTADFDSAFVFYYDETNNIRKFYVKEEGFNNSFNTNFVLGGLVHEQTYKPNIQPLITSFKLQPTIKEIKFKHITSGDFLQCLDSDKLQLFLQFIKDSEFYVHYLNLNVLYWSLVDIIDSAIAESEVAISLGPYFGNHLKNDLYKLSRLEIESVTELFYEYQYPNIKSESVISFIRDLTSLFSDYIDDPEFHFGLESLRQILKEASKQNALPFIMDEDDYILLKDFSNFYLKRIYMFKNSEHIFDDEKSVVEIIGKYHILDNGEEIKNYKFVDSQTNPIVQLSDVFVGLMGKLTTYLNTSSREEIIKDFGSLSPLQEANIDLLLDVIDKSDKRNIAFLHNIESQEENSKILTIRSVRNK